MRAPRLVTALLVGAASLLPALAVRASPQPGPEAGRAPAAAQSSATVTNDEKRQAVAGLCTALRARYVLEDVAERAARKIEARLAAGAYATSDAQEFGAAVTADLQRVTQDRHLRFGVPAGEPPRPAGAAPGAADAAAARAAARRAAAEAARQSNYGFARAEILSGNVGYLDLRRFVPPDSAGDTLVGAMAFLANTDALIIDLRHCTGGATSMMPFLAAYFFDRPTSLFDMEFRGDHFTEHYWTLGWMPGRRRGTVPLYLLTSARTFSGAEAFAYRFQVLKRAVVVGETTGGGANAGGVLDIPPRFRVWMPMGRPVDQQTHTNWEGTGVVPDVTSPAREALEAAWQHALRVLQSEARTEADRARLAWAQERATAAAHPVEVSPAALDALAGTYGSARVWVEGGQLRYRRETEQTVPLTPLTPLVFATDLDDPIRVEFVKGADGRVDRLLVTFDDFVRKEMPRQR